MEADSFAVPSLTRGYRVKAAQTAASYTVGDVRRLIDAEQVAEALVVLRWVLQHNPSADAWFLAAVYTDDEQQKINHLRRGLLLDPSHRECRALLARYTTTYPGWGTFILSELAHEIHRQSDRSLLLRRLPPRLQVAAVSLAFITLVVGFGLLVVANRSRMASAPVFAAEAPPATALTLVTGDAIVDQLAASDLGRIRIERIQRPAQPDKQSIMLSREGQGTRAPMAEIHVYDSVSALIADRDYLSSSARGPNVVALPNAVMIYDPALPDALAANLIAAFRRAGANSSAS